MTQPTVADLFDAYEQEYLPDQAPSTQQDKHNLFRRIRMELGAVAVADLTPHMLRAWRDRLSAHVGAGTLLTYMHQFSAALRVAVDDYEWIATNPLAKVHKPSRPPERVRFLDMDEQQRLFAACQHSRLALLYPVVVLAISTGARRGECLLRRWEDIDLERGLLQLERTKTKLKRGVPMPQMTVAVLRQWQAQRTGPWVFPGARGAVPAEIGRPWRAAVAAAHLENFRFHDLRHTAASYLAMSGVRIEDISEILGHKNIQTTRRYRHLSLSYTAALVEQMARQFVHLT